MINEIETAPEIGPLPGDVEYEVSILKLEKRMGGDAGAWAGKEFLMVTLDVPAEPTCESFNHMMKLPDQGDTSKEAVRERNAVKEFAQGFGIPLRSLFEFDDSEPPRCQAAVGSTARIVLGQREDKRTPGKFQNVIKQYVGSASSKPATKRGR
jgi:hypothetical protein